MFFHSNQPKSIETLHFCCKCLSLNSSWMVVSLTHQGGLRTPPGRASKGVFTCPSSGRWDVLVMQIAMADLSQEKTPGGNHYKDPYWTNSIMESRRIFVRGSFGKKLQFLDYSNLGPAWAPGKQRENDHHNFTKKPLLSFIMLQCLGRIQNGNVVQTSWNHQLDSQRVIQLVDKISTSPLLRFNNKLCKCIAEGTRDNVDVKNVNM